MFDERLNSSDCVLVVGSTVPMRYYYRKELPCLLVAERSGSNAHLQNIIADRLYFISSHGPRLQGDQILEALLSDRWSTRQEFPFHDVRVLELEQKVLQQ